MPKVLITGANGFIGANIVRAALEKGYEVKAFVRKGSDMQALEELPIEFAYGDLNDIDSLAAGMDDCEYIIHAGAIYLFLPMWFWADPAKIKSMYDTNVWATDKLFAKAQELGIKKVIFTSSESAVGMPPGGGIGNETRFATPRELPGHYKRSKYLGELVALKWHRKGLPVCSILPTVPIGPYDVKPTPTGRIIRDFMNGQMPGFVDTRMNVVAVKDVAMAHVLAIDNGRSGERYIAGNKNFTFRDFLRLIADVAGKKAPGMSFPSILAKSFAFVDEFTSCLIKHTDPKTPLESVAASANYREFDCTKAWTELGMPRTNLRIAIKDQIDWFRENGYLKTK
ncbi:MAG TPA: NAD-dependent epimerase/dehydratase family protein [Candidatus Lokiarchaeia archaeon]|nr:NAD-dependent epimerase/dehydratase family protein [Candidatus Lokiarchaeia archaeon]